MIEKQMMQYLIHWVFIYEKNNMITEKILKEMAPWTIIATWYFENNEENVFLTRDKKAKEIVKFVAVRWWIHDWVIYCEDLYNKDTLRSCEECIKSNWWKLPKSMVKKVIQCDNFAFNIYRG